ncbi:hypothetical protein B0J12DRAFT_584893 [Macrophomina phaseolina]|uniref:Uncharacterized protein n=1 Tax=Macrophomina phaseolina TaxID=35725 RepID=A0ABQ8FTT2_9PEZI|nr:hypothetical protein B0J12DRAFT_584893 [Macrophomina phaseolina]
MASSIPRTRRGSRRGDSAERGRGRGRGAAPEAEDDLFVHPRPLSPPPSHVQAYSVADSSTTTRNTTARAAGPRNPRFRETVLAPRCINVIRTSERAPDAHTHFCTMPPDDNDYTRLEGLHRIGIWLSLGASEVDDVMEEYREMQLRQLCEEEFAGFAKETLLKSQRRARRADEDGLWRVERLVQPVCPPDESCYWAPPPLLVPPVAAQTTQWSWDVRPDCSYWLSLDGFNQEYSFQVEGKTYVKSQSICPYFTVEFKRTGESDEIATNQVAAAGAMALYNRFCLHRAVATARSPGWNQTPEKDLRHYGLTFIGPNYTIWVLRARISDDGAWNGCNMEKLASGNCAQRTVQVRHLVCWINEIHRWGLTVHGLHCKNEIKALLRGSGVRTSSFDDG